MRQQPKLVEAIQTAGILICPVAEISLGAVSSDKDLLSHLAVEYNATINEPPGHPLRKPIMLVPGHILHSTPSEVTL